MKTPVIFAHIAERRGNPALRRDGMGTGRKDLGNQRGFQPLFRAAKPGAQTGPAGADDDNIVFMIDNGVGVSHIYCAL